MEQFFSDRTGFMTHHSSFHALSSSITPVFRGVVIDIFDLFEITDLYASSVESELYQILPKSQNPIQTDELEKFFTSRKMSLLEGLRGFMNSRRLEYPEGQWWRTHTEPSDLHAIKRIIAKKCGEAIQHLSEKKQCDRIRKSCSWVLRSFQNSGVVVGVCSPEIEIPNGLAKILPYVQEIGDLKRLLAWGHRTNWEEAMASYDSLCYQSLCTEMGVTASDTVFFFGPDACHTPLVLTNFGLSVSVGIDRDDVSKSTADLSVPQFEDADVTILNTTFDEMRGAATWKLKYTRYDPKAEPLRESLTCVGNGYMGSRGCWEGVTRVRGVHYAGNYIAGIYNTLTSIVAGREVKNSDLVNVPNWALMELYVDGVPVDPLDTQNFEIESYEHSINLKEAVVSHNITLCERATGRRTQIHTRRVCNMRHYHQAAISYNVVALNYSTEKMEVRSALDGTVTNDLVERYRGLNNHHLQPSRVEAAGGGIYLAMTTKTSCDEIGMYARHSVHINKFHSYVGQWMVRVSEDNNYIEEVMMFPAPQGQLVTVEKLVAVFTSKDVKRSPEEASVEIFRRCTTELDNCLRYSQISETNRRMWRDIWHRSEFTISGDRCVQQMVKVHTYHLFVTMSQAAEDAEGLYGMPARGLSGEAYRGHVFWDEVYMFPFYLSKFPSIAKAHLRYRIRLLPEAKKYAAEMGFRGAMIPWQVSDSGKEETQTMHYNPLSQKWGPDKSSRQRHVGIAVFLNAWRYYMETKDIEFLKNGRLAELMLEIALFWLSITSGPEADGRYHIHGVMGPDEFHEECNGQAGLSDNAYTNVMVVWLFGKAFHILQDIDELTKQSLFERVKMTPADLEKMKDVMKRMYVGMDDSGIVEQFSGYFTLERLNFSLFRAKYGNIRRMDRILKTEGLNADLYQISKQPDVLMIFYLLRLEEVVSIFEELGYARKDPHQWLADNYDYYVQRCTHGSTLSYTVHARIAHMCNRPEGMWEWFMTAATSEIYDTQGTTGEGIHCAVMAGTLHLLVSMNSGLRRRQDALEVNPNLPRHVNHVQFTTRIGNIMYEFSISKASVRITMLSGDEETYEEKCIKPLSMKVGKVTIDLAPWQPAEVFYAPLNTMCIFLEKMRQTRHIRRRFVYNYFDLSRRMTSSTEFHLSMMRNILSWLRKVPQNTKGPFLISGSGTSFQATSTQVVNVNLSYEIKELEKDIAYMEDMDVAKLYAVMRENVPRFDDEVAETERFLSSTQFHTFITDRDGTINNYGCTYMTTVQSGYNAVFLSAFARNCRKAIILTAAPLRDFVDLHTNLRGLFILAGSKGREFQDETGTSFTSALDPEEIEILGDFNSGVVALLQQPNYIKFSQIGSGVQYKHGSTTIARQDTCGSIKKSESEKWKEVLSDLAEKVGREKTVINDTGTDLEIEVKQPGVEKTFSKADGLAILERELFLDLATGPLLVCGDTSSDLCMLEYCMTKCPDKTFSVFVTTNEGLKAKVKALCPRVCFVSSPDVLVSALYRVSKTQDAYARKKSFEKETSPLGSPKEFVIPTPGSSGGTGSGNQHEPLRLGLFSQNAFKIYNHTRSL